MLNKLLERFEEGAIALLLGAMTILTFVQVVLRYGFNSGISWAYEATTYLFGWLIFLGISYGVKKGSHIGVDVLVRQLPRGGQRFMGLLVVGLCLLYAGLMLYGGWKYLGTMITLGVEAEDIPIPRWILLLAIPIGLIMLLIRLLEVAWLILTGHHAGMRLADEAKEAIDQFGATPPHSEQPK